MTITRTDRNGIGTNYKVKVISKPKDDHEEVMACLRRAPALRELTEEVRQRVETRMTLQFFENNVPIITEGEPGDNYYIIREGAVTVSSKAQGKVCDLRKGNDFGQTALQNDEPRNATVVTCGYCSCLVLKRADFEMIQADSVRDVAQSWMVKTSLRSRSEEDPESALVSIGMGENYEIVPAFSPSITEYSVIVPPDSKKLLSICPWVREPAKKVQRTVPIVGAVHLCPCRVSEP